MSKLSAIPGLPPEAVDQLIACGVESAEMLAGIPPVEIHRVLELAAWKKGPLNRAPSLATVQEWAELAKKMPAGAASDDQQNSTAAPHVDDDIPEAIVVPTANLNYGRGGYIPPAQRAKLDAAGLPVPAAAPQPLPREEVPMARPIPMGLPVHQPRPAAPAASPPASEPAASKFSTFNDYQSGNLRVAPLNRQSIDAPPEPIVPGPPERINANEELPRTMRRGVVHPNPGLLVFGALISLLWRLALLASFAGVAWLLVEVPRPSVYAGEIALASLIMLFLGVAQLIVMGKARCRICSCHLFYSRNCVKNRKAHSIPGIGKTASLALHLLIFQWFRCMYCGTAIKLRASKADRAS